jgi:hypothetical protein
MSDAANMSSSMRAVDSAEVAPRYWLGDNAWLSMANGWSWLRRHSKGLLARQAARRLRMIETLSLGEKRFVSIVEVDGEQFLLGGSASSVALLAKLEGCAKSQQPLDGAEPTFAEVLSRADTRAQTNAADLGMTRAAGQEV